MELVYLWVEDYKNIHHQGFNFSPRFRCDYDPATNELTIDENEDYIPDFFGDNINVTAIVGKNGSGKSSIAESLQATSITNPMQDETEFASKYIFVLNVDKGSYENNGFLSIKDNLQIKTNINNIIFAAGEEFDKRLDFLFEPLFYDAELPYNKFNEYEIASENFIATPEFDNAKEYVYVDLDFNSVCKKLLKINNTILLDDLDFVPETLIIKPSYSTLEKSKNFMIYDYHKRPRFSDDIIKKVDNAIEKVIDGEDFFVFSLFLSNIDDFSNKDIADILDAINSNGDIIITLKPYLEMIDTELNLDEYETLLTEDINISDVNVDLLIKYFEYLDIEIIDRKNRNFKNLSHGEKTFYGMAVNIIYFFQMSRCKNFLLCFDEPDLSLHPDWQKRYINEIYNLLKQVKGNIHFIFTTHSPFLLSDIPKQNIIFLDTDENGKCKVLTQDQALDKEQTFGQNIHTLLSDSFFMEDGLMGEFAESKINEAIQYLRRENDIYDDKQKELFNLINIIGEPFLKKKLLELYYEKFRDEATKTKRKEELKQQKASIERELSRL